MAEKKRSCVIDGCKTPAKTGLKVCSHHEHVAALQAAYQSERAANQVWEILRFEPLRRITKTLAELDSRATPLKGGNVEVVARSRSHNLGDRIATLGTDVATHAQGVSTYRDRGKLGAAVSVLERTAGELEQIADPRSQPTTKRCGSKDCPEPNRRQPIEHRHCGYCGRQFRKAS